MEVDYAHYYHRLQGLIGHLSEELPETMTAFRELHKVATAEGTISRKNKELIALAVAMTVNCDGCLAYHVQDALEAGATREEILETIGVVVMMGGGPGVVYACQAMEALDQLEADRREAGRVPAL